ncbi:DinB family protein [Nocardioides marmoribigeumensis]|jgi:uncharacterized damage-inducible protein DinB|uniref:Damage-inducible protein DinB n=1 Tax=Nocardioides marmoribigeumensis TaxID=433649 RepID=A0ABU2BXC8_9ACTN|nr:DinB family protein [Nocardioides marmoribigeumensis]MDR7363042.1 putative damage-inducible protein DinB [Nocardioides marmoribigeumensis]
MDDIHLADERTLLLGLLDRQRAEIVALLDDVSEEEGRARLVPSLTTVMGLVKHATFVEKVWFHSRVAGVPRHVVGLPDDIDSSFVVDDTDTVASVREAYLAACDHSRTVVEGRDLDEEHQWRTVRVSLRYIVLHMVQELARHAGHGDILVEQLQARR